MLARDIFQALPVFEERGSGDDFWRVQGWAVFWYWVFWTLVRLVKDTCRSKLLRYGTWGGQKTSATSIVLSSEKPFPFQCRAIQNKPESELHFDLIEEDEQKFFDSKSVRGEHRLSLYKQSHPSKPSVLLVYPAHHSSLTCALQAFMLV